MTQQTQKSFAEDVAELREQNAGAPAQLKFIDAMERGYHRAESDEARQEIHESLLSGLSAWMDNPLLQMEQGIAVPVMVSMKDIASLIESALSGGSNYWCGGTQTTVEPQSWDFVSEPIREDGGHWESYYPLNEGGALILRDNESDVSNKDEILNLEGVKKGLALMAEKEPKYFAYVLSGDADQVTADVFLQLCLFGEVIYG